MIRSFARLCGGEDGALPSIGTVGRSVSGSVNNTCFWPVHSNVKMAVQNVVSAAFFGFGLGYDHVLSKYGLRARGDFDG